MTTTTKAMAKVAAVATGLAMATSMLSLAPIAHAACSVGTANLTVGSSGAGVTCLQQGLIANGYGIAAGATGYFGGQTQAAVKAWQTAAGVSPAAGYFGPVSRAAWNLGGSSSGGTSTVPGCSAGAMFSSTTGQSCASTTTVAGCAPGAMFSSTTGQACGTTTTTSTGPLAGTDGSISDYTLIGSFNNEEVSEGNNGVKVYGADVEVSNDGDIALKSIKVSFDPAGNTGSDNLDDYFDSVDIWLGSTKVGSADSSDFTQNDDDTWTKTITLSNAVIRADDTSKLYISVDAVSNIDTGDITGDSWTVAVENIRFIDGSGVTTTDDSTNDIGATVPISLVSFSTSANTELKVSTATDSPDAGIVKVDETSNTENVLLLKGKLKLEGTSDVLLDSFPVTFTTSAGDVASTTGSVTLKLGSQEFTETVTDSNPDDNSITVVFNNLNFNIDAGSTVNFEVSADINDIDTGVFDEGDTLQADVTATNVDDMDVENSEGDQLDDTTEKSGTASGEAQTFRTDAITVGLVSVSAVSNNNDAADTGTFKIRFKVTADGDAVYIASLAANAVTYVVDRSGTATTAGSISPTLTAITGSNSTTFDDLTAVGNYTIEDGDYLTLELMVTVPNGAGGATAQYRSTLSSLKWDTTDDITPSNTYDSGLSNFKTDYVLLDNA